MAARWLAWILCLGVLMNVSCGGDKATSYSLLATGDNFLQSAESFNNRLDVLWVIDNSGSMGDDQANLAANFQSFIVGFDSKGFDYQMAVTTTDAWKAPHTGQPELARFKPGYESPGGTAHYIITPNTPNKQNVFMSAVSQGTRGSGDERAFQSLQEALNSSVNAPYGFLRPNSLLAVIILSDEDDFSNSGTRDIGHNYSDPRLYPVTNYLDALDVLTGTTDPTRRRFSVNTIAIVDSVCAVNNQWGILGQRYMQLADLTGGVKASICDNFADSLNVIQNGISELLTQFYLSKVPHPGTLQVMVDNSSVPENTQNGYTYSGSSNSVTFHGTHIPGAGARINVSYIPTTL